MDSSSIKALTLPYDRLSNVIACSVNVSFPKSLLDEGKEQVFIPHIAIWDTGATACAVTELFAKKLGLIQTGVKDVSGLGGTIEKKTYLIDLQLPNGNLYVNLDVTEIDNAKDVNGNLVDSFGILIGMDIITTGDFTITNFENKTTMTFRTPSLKKVDYVDEWRRRVTVENKSKRK